MYTTIIRSIINCLVTGFSVTAMVLLFFSEYAVAADTTTSGNAVINLTSQSITQRILAMNRSIEASRDRLDIARLQFWQAQTDFNFKFYPDVSAGWSVGADNEQYFDWKTGVALTKRFRIGGNVSIKPLVQQYLGDYSTNLLITMEQPLLRGRGEKVAASSVIEAVSNVRQMHMQLYQNQVDIILLGLATAYQIVQWKEIYALHEASVKRMEMNAQIATSRQQLGHAGALDVYRAEIQLRSARERLVSSQEQFEDALDQLRNILELPFDAEIEITIPELDLKSTAMDATPTPQSDTCDAMLLTDYDSAVNEALLNRIEILEAQETIDAANRSLQLAKHGLLPELNMVAQYSRADNLAPTETISESSVESWSLGLRSGTDIARASERIAYKQALIRVKFAEQQMADTKESIAREIKSLMRELTHSSERLELQKETIRQAYGKMELAKIKFARGLTDNFSVLESENELVYAETAAISEKVRYRIARLRLEAALGRLLEKPRFDNMEKQR